MKLNFKKNPPTNFPFKPKKNIKLPTENSRRITRIKKIKRYLLTQIETGMDAALVWIK